MAQFQGFCGPTYTSAHRQADAERAINLYPEVIESGHGKSGARVALLGTPGYALFASLPDQPVRGVYSGDGVRLFAASGRTVYEVFSDGTHNELGRVSDADSVGRAQFFANGTSLFVVSGQNMYASNGVATPGQILPVVVAAVAGAYIDGYMIALDPGLKKFVISSLFGGGAAADWDPADFGGAQGEPSSILSILADHRELWLFKERSIEVFDDDGAANFPFERNPAGFIEQGIIAAATPARLDNTVFWLGGDERGAGVVWRAQGYTPSRVSNHAVETAIEKYPRIDDAEAFGYQQNGHSFYVLHFPSAHPTTMGGVRGATWVYDCAASAMLGTPQWHERAYWDPIHAVWMMHRGRCHAYCFGKHLIGDWLAGKIYALDPMYRQDDQNPLRWLRRAPHLSDEMREVFYDEIQIDLDTGVGLANDIPVINTQTAPETAVGINDNIAQINAHLAAGPQPVTIGESGSDPQVILRWSDDGARTWSPDRLLSAGKIGEYSRRVRKTRMGKSRNRTYELSGSDPVPVAIVNAYLRTTPGNGS